MTMTSPRPIAPTGPNLRDPSLYLNRELSWLEFNRRVLHEALDPRTPLLPVVPVSPALLPVSTAPTTQEEQQ